MDARGRRWEVAVDCAAAVLAALVLLVKLRGLSAWQYGADLFWFDQAAAETLRGHFGQQFAYGSEFGEHAEFLLLALLPAKALLGGRFAALLMALSPLAYALGLAVAFRALRRGTEPWKAALGLSPLLLAGHVLHGLLEPFYGFHFDILAAFAGLSWVLLLARQDAGAPRASWGAWLALALCCLAKEDYALLSCAALAFLWWRRPDDKRLRPMLAFAAAVLACGLLLVASQRTFLNSDRAKQAALTLAALKAGTLSARGGWWTVWAALGGGVAAAAFFEGGLGPYAGALVLMAAVRLPECVLLRDFLPDTWHTLPQLIFLGGAFALQVCRARSRPALALAGLLAAGAACQALFQQVPELLASARRLPSYYPSAQVQADLAGVIARVPPRAVVAIPELTAWGWAKTGRRFSYLPSGVTTHPRGVASYAVLPARPNEKIPELPSCFSETARNATFVLYERRPPCPSLDEDRALFVKTYGPGSLD